MSDAQAADPRKVAAAAINAPAQPSDRGNTLALTTMASAGPASQSRSALRTTNAENVLAIAKRATSG